MDPLIEWTPEQTRAALAAVMDAEMQVWTQIAAQLLTFYGYIPDELLPLAKQMAAKRLASIGAPSTD